MDEKAIRLAALVTLRRAILERFPRGARAAGVAYLGRYCLRAASSFSASAA